ncbi:dihydroxyacetone kinase subunit DhaL [Mycoplasmopsis columboralis]|uniref:Glycerone kinase n=1 Tax=Mycoplasmopsis columboralis TaxID=171282 RepID=A0A449B641_9BACT|nr:dihydroxyacetone kinase subunit DhaL [Mycoplasmopsis columboralis]VEU76066.1 glycerone kinase [Mycoplasmopsis columboralis]
MKSELIIKIIREISKMLDAKADELTELDRLIGDGDHGINLKRGFNTLEESLDKFKDKTAKELLNNAAMTLMSKVGGSSGPLLGTIFMKLAQSDNFAKGALEAANGVQMRGKAQVGDKTMLDVLMPFAQTYNEQLAQGKSNVDALEIALAKAHDHLELSKTLVAKKGRASYLGERSVGVTDPGTQSIYYMLEIIVREIKANG